MRRLSDVRAGHVVLCAGAGTEALWPGVTMRRVVHLRVTFAAALVAAEGGAGAGPAATSWGLPTWADRTGRFGALTYGVADGPGRFALGLAELDAQPAPPDLRAADVPPDCDLAAVRDRIHAYAAAAFPELGAPVGEVVRLLTVLPGDDEDAYVLHSEPGLTVLAGHNLFKLAPLLGERIADAAVLRR